MFKYRSKFVFIETLFSWKNQGPTIAVEGIVNHTVSCGECKGMNRAQWGYIEAILEGVLVYYYKKHSFVM